MVPRVKPSKPRLPCSHLDGVADRRGVDAAEQRQQGVVHHSSSQRMSSAVVASGCSRVGRWPAPAMTPRRDAGDQGVHQFVPVARAEPVVLAHQDERRAAEAASVSCWSGREASARDWRAKTSRAEVERHGHAEVEDVGPARAVGEVVRLHLVAHDARRGRRRSARAICGSRAAATSGVSAQRLVSSSASALDPVRGLAQHLHRDDAAHREAGEREARRGVGEHLRGERRHVSWPASGARCSGGRPDRAAICGPKRRASHIMPGRRTSGVMRRGARPRRGWRAWPRRSRDRRRRSRRRCRSRSRSRR